MSACRSKPCATPLVCDDSFHAERRQCRFVQRGTPLKIANSVAHVIEAIPELAKLRPKVQPPVQPTSRRGSGGRRGSPRSSRKAVDRDSRKHAPELLGSGG